MVLWMPISGEKHGDLAAFTILNKAINHRHNILPARNS
jgi:hypothetical protein